jgi:NAD-dependent deacetylase
VTQRQLEFYSSIVVLTGAGVSARSGVPVYRGSEDLHPLQVLARQAQPNDCQLALAQWEARVLERGGEFLLVTQNPDGLHQKAGSQNVVELRGSLHRLRCDNRDCAWKEDRFWDWPLAPCPVCGGHVRPDVVRLGEDAPPEPEWIAKRALRRCDLFLALGIGGNHPVATRFAELATEARARTVLVNLEDADRAGDVFEETHLEAAEDFVPQIWVRAQQVTEPARVRPESILQPARYALEEGLKALAALLDAIKVGYLAMFDIADFKTRNHMLGYAAGDQDLEDFAEIAVHCGVEGVVRYHQDQFIVLTSRVENLQALVDTYRREEPVQAGYHARIDGEHVRTVAHELKIRRGLRGAYSMVFRGQPLEHAIGNVAERVKYAPVDSASPLTELNRPYQAWSALLGKFSALHCPRCQGHDFEWEIGDPTRLGNEGTCRGCGSRVEFQNYNGTRT